MQILKGSRETKRSGLKNPVITIGNFDGVHRGHQRILKKVIQRARSLDGTSAVYTFNPPSPIKVDKPRTVHLWVDTIVNQKVLAEELRLVSLELLHGGLLQLILSFEVR